MEDFVGRLTGKQTMYQMVELANQIELRGGPRSIRWCTRRCTWTSCTPRSPTALEELRKKQARRRSIWCRGRAALLEALQGRGLKLYLASGTDQQYMREEADLVDVAKYFDGRVYGALDDYKSFSKKILIQRLIATTECRGDAVPGLRRRLRRDRKGEAGGRRHRGGRDHRAGVRPRGRVEAAAAGRRRGGLHRPEFPLSG